MSTFTRPGVQSATHILYVCRHGDLPALRSALRHPSTDVNACFADGWTPLHYAADRSDTVGTLMIAALLAAGARVCVCDRTRATPLHLAVDAGNKDSVRLLLEAGADVNAANERGYTALHIAARRASAQIVSWLLQLHAPVQAGSVTGRTPMHEAAAVGAQRVVQMLAKHGARLNAVEALQGDTPLHVAARVGQAEMCRTLLELGADIHAVNAMNETPVQTAVRHDKYVLAAALPRMWALHRRWWLLKIIVLLHAGRAEFKRHRPVLERYAELSRSVSEVAVEGEAQEPPVAPTSPSADKTVDAPAEAGSAPSTPERGVSVSTVASSAPAAVASAAVATGASWITSSLGRASPRSRFPRGIALLDTEREGVGDPSNQASPRDESVLTRAASAGAIGRRGSKSSWDAESVLIEAHRGRAAAPEVGLVRSSSCPVPPHVVRADREELGADEPGGIPTAVVSADDSIQADLPTNSAGAATAFAVLAPSAVGAAGAVRPSTASGLVVAAASDHRPRGDDDDGEDPTEIVLAKATLVDMEVSAPRASSTRPPARRIDIGEVADLIMRLSRMPPYVWEVTVSFF